MADIIAFPKPNEREWREVEAELRKTVRPIQGGLDALEDCLPAIKQHWQDIFQPIKTTVTLEPFSKLKPLSADQLAAFTSAAISNASDMVEKLTDERETWFAKIALVEWRLALCQRG